METLTKYPSMTLNEWIAKTGARCYLSQEIVQDHIFRQTTLMSPRSSEPKAEEINDWQKCLQEIDRLDIEEAKQRLGITLIREEGEYEGIYEDYPTLDPFKEYGMSY